MRTLRRWWWLLPLALILALAGFVIWAKTAAAPMPEALAALESDAQVLVETEPWLIFRPVSQNPTVGLVIYPGGRVDPRAYAPAAREIAAEGYLAVIAPMPLNLAVLSPNRVADVIAAFPEIRRWALGGHSLGGSMAARYAHQNPESVQALVLWAAYPAASDDLSDASLATTSIFGTRDGLTTKDDIEASQTRLPSDTNWVAIEGGNHAQFGWYGSQSGDLIATITREDQQQQTVAATLNLLSRLGD